MSKAFTSEETPDTGPLTRSPPRLSPGEVRYITPEGQAALRSQLARAREERQAALGLRESERLAAMAKAETRIALLEGTLAALTVLGPEAAPQGRVAFGTWVVVEDEAGTRSTWRVVGPDESDARRGWLSAQSPLGQALLGREVGESVEVRRPGGLVEYTVLEVRRTEGQP